MNSHDAIHDFEQTMKGKAAIDAARAYKLYLQLIKNGHDPQKAFLIAFTGLKIIDIPGIQPVPEPDPPLKVRALYQSLQEVHTNVVRLEASIKAELKFFEPKIEK
jgi:hypothetical protein